MRILLTTTSYQDTPGAHHDLLKSSGYEVVRARGPLTSGQLLDLIRQAGPFDAFLHGDDQITSQVIDAALPQLKCLCKYGIGLDSVDVVHATRKKIPVLFTPGVNHTTVAEHAFGLIIAVARHFWVHARSVKAGEWKRRTGCELMGRTLGVLGMGRIGREMVLRARAFGMKTMAYDPYWDENFAVQHQVKRCPQPQDVLRDSDVVTLHLPLTEQTAGFIRQETLALMRKGSILINTARGGLVVEEDVAEACRSGRLMGYGTDVLNDEPIRAPHPFQNVDNIFVTPHIGSRTFESVERQALRATLNLLHFFQGNPDYIQANPF